MAKAQGKKTATVAGKSAAKRVTAGVKRTARAARNKVTPKKKAAAPVRPAAKTAAKKTAPKKAVPARATPKKAVAKKPASKAAKAVARPVKKAAAKVKVAAKAVKKATKKAVRKVAKAAPAVKPGRPATDRARKAAPPQPRPAPPPPTPGAPVPPPVVAAPEPEKKRGRRARTRIQSSGAPAAAWLTSEKPRPASFIPAPPRAEAPSAIAAPPASSDRLLRPDDVGHPAVRTVPVRIDIEQGAGRFYVIASPAEVSVRAGEGIEWDFRYIGGADVTVEEIVIEFQKPSPFAQPAFRTRKPGGARPHRQMSGGAVPSASGRRVQYTIRAMTGFRTEVASTNVWLNIQ